MFSKLFKPRKDVAVFGSGCPKIFANHGAKLETSSSRSPLCCENGSVGDVVNACDELRLPADVVRLLLFVSWHNVQARVAPKFGDPISASACLELFCMSSALSTSPIPC